MKISYLSSTNISLQLKYESIKHFSARITLYDLQSINECLLNTIPQRLFC